MTNINKEMTAMMRGSLNGYETCFAYHQDTYCSYHWELIRYPLDAWSEEPTESLLQFFGRFDWQDAIDQAKAYLANHPEDGFSI